MAAKVIIRILEAMFGKKPEPTPIVPFPLLSEEARWNMPLEGLRVHLEASKKQRWISYSIQTQCLYYARKAAERCPSK